MKERKQEELLGKKRVFLERKKERGVCVYVLIMCAKSLKSLAAAMRSAIKRV